MVYRHLGSSGFAVSTVAMGCMSLDARSDFAADVVHKALDFGINLFDTADLYDKGENERLLGKALQGHRQQAIVSTKVGNRWRSDGSGWDWCPEKAYIQKAIDQSLSRLRTDYIDLYLLHGGTLEDPIDEIIETFERLRDYGKIRAYGISSIRPNVVREYAGRANLSAVMTQYSLLDRRPEEEILPLLQSKDIGVLCRGVLAQGMLSGKEPKDYLGWTAPEIRSALKNLNPASALDFVTGRPGITSAVLGVRNQSQLLDNLEAYGADALEAAARNNLEHTFPARTYELHR